MEIQKFEIFKKVKIEFWPFWIEFIVHPQITGMHKIILHFDGQNEGAPYSPLIERASNPPSWYYINKVAADIL